MAACCTDGVEKENCGDCRIWEEELYWNRFHSFYFCQILSSVSEFHKQLAIPKKFADNARTLLPPKVTLRGPSRASWCAVMTKRDDDLFLTDGWEEFVRAYSLQASDILIFKFDGVSVFDVLIFDGENLCEKESAYFVKKCRHENGENPRKGASCEADIEEHDEEGVLPRATKQSRDEVVVSETPSGSKYSNFYSRMRKKCSRKATSSKSSPRERIPRDMNNHDGSAENGQSNVQSEPCNNETQNTEMNGSPATETLNGISPSETNRSFSTKTPPPDTPHINESIVYEATPLRVASARGRPRKGSGSHGIRTKASSSKRASSVGRKRKQLDSNTAGEELALNLSGEEFALGSPDSSGPRYVTEEGKLALEMARKQMNPNSFIVIMRPTTVCKRYIVTIPPAWCRKHLSPNSQDVFFRFGDKTFVTRLSYCPRKSTGQICSGWKRVVLENQLKLYDVCLFNIATRKDDAVMLDVSVFRGGLQREPVHPPSLQMDEPSSPTRDVE